MGVRTKYHKTMELCQINRIYGSLRTFVIQRQLLTCVLPNGVCGYGGDKRWISLMARAQRGTIACTTTYDGRIGKALGLQSGPETLGKTSVKLQLRAHF